MATYVTSFATDEDIAIRCKTDFELLCAREYLAQGNDGVFAPGATWTMTSASSDFAGQGVARGNVVILKSPAPTIGPVGAMFAVDAVDASGGLALRRLGQLPGVGYPPGPVAGANSVGFSIPTLAAQIESASYEVDARFGINDLITGRRVADMFDRREVRDVTVLTVLQRRYLDLAKQAEVGGNDVYYAKSTTYENKLNEMLDRVTIHWRNSSTPAQQTNRFTTRVER